MTKTRIKAQPNSAITFAANNPKAIYWLASNIVAGIVALFPSPVAPYAGTAVAGGVNTGFYVSTTSKRRIDEAVKAGKLDRSKFQAELNRLAEDKAAIAQLHKGIERKESQLLAIEGSLATQQKTMKDRMLMEAQREAQATGRKKLLNLVG
ncbi:MAG: hypothetical protein AAGL17_22190, partial [Cyanobacteria bacterium J06576_12]